MTAGLISMSRRFFLAAKRVTASGEKDGATIRLDEELRDLLGGGSVHLAIDAEHAAKGGDGVCGECAGVGVEDGRTGGGATGIGVLDDDDGGFVELTDELPAGIEVDQVVVRELFTLQLFGGRDTRS